MRITGARLPTTTRSSLSSTLRSPPASLSCRAGNLDAAYVTQATYVNNLSSGSVSGSVLVQKVSQGVTGIQLAAGPDSVGAFADINVRKAFAHGIQIENMINGLGQGMYQVASSVLGRRQLGLSGCGHLEYDPDAAKAALAEAGYSVDNPLTVTVVAESTAFYTSLMEASRATWPKSALTWTCPAWATLLPFCPLC